VLVYSHTDTCVLSVTDTMFTTWASLVEDDFKCLQFDFFFFAGELSPLVSLFLTCVVIGSVSTCLAVGMPESLGGASLSSVALLTSPVTVWVNASLTAADPNAFIYLVSVLVVIQMLYQVQQ